MADSDGGLRPIEEIPLRALDEGERGRPTVALVDAKVDGLKDLIRAEFANIREDIKPLFPLVVQVALLERANTDLDRRLADIEKREDKRAADVEGRADKDRDYRRVNLPSLVIAGVLAIVTIVTNVLNLFHI